MKEIKFRVWAAGEMHYPDIISFDANGASFTPANGGGGSFRVPLGEVMQFTGLKDKNNRRIYVGDILKETAPRGNRYVVYDVPGGFAINSFQDHDKRFHESTADMQVRGYLEASCAVIGDICSNLDLLK